MSFSLPLPPCVCAITTDTARRKQPLSTGKGAKNIIISLVGHSRSRLSSQLALGEGECLLWELGELHALMLLEGACMWRDYTSKPSVCPLKFHSGVMCLCWGACVPIPAGSCQDGSCCLQGASLGALPHVCFFSPWEEKPPRPLSRAGFELLEQMHHRGVTCGGQAGVSWELPRDSSSSLRAGGAVGSAPAQGLSPGD